MNILLTNDDGIYADGISALYRALQARRHEVIVVAPYTQQSAIGHAITVSDPLKVSHIELESKISGYAVQGTPADCIKIGINALLDKKPDMVLSGINQGANTGNHIIYSGTVSAATEATMYGIPAIAVSLDVPVLKENKNDYTYAARFAANLCDTVKHHGLPVGTLLNVNVPGIEAGQIKGIRFGKQAHFQHVDVYEKRIDPRNRVYYWLKEEEVVVTESPEIEVDYRLLKEGYIVITPIQYDLTDYAMLNRLKGWSFDF